MNRTGFIGGSDIASIIGISPWKSAYALWEEKMGDAALPEDEQREKVFRRGKRLEPVVMEMLQEEHNLTIVGRNVILVDEAEPWMRAEIDFRFLGADGVVCNGDVKTVHPYAAKDWGDEGTDQFPAYYGAQFQWGMTFEQTPLCMPAALIGADDLRLYSATREPAVGEFLRESARRFWYDHVLPGIPPPVATKEDAAKVLAKFEGMTAEASNGAVEACRRIRGLREAIKRLEKAKARQELELQLEMATAVPDGIEPDKCALVGKDGKPLVSWNLQRRAGFTVAPTEYRVMRVRS